MHQNRNILSNILLQNYHIEALLKYILSNLMILHSILILYSWQEVNPKYISLLVKSCQICQARSISKVQRQQIKYTYLLWNKLWITKLN